MLRKLSAIRALPDSDGAVEVGTCPAHGRNRLAAKATGVIGQPEIAQLAPGPVSGFNRLMKPQKPDKGCVATTRPQRRGPLEYLIH
jgi:hypothetical protein